MQIQSLIRYFIFFAFFEDEKSSSGLFTICQTNCPDKTKELFKIMQHPEKVLAKMSELDKSLLVKELIKNITVQYDNLEIKWTAIDDCIFHFITLNSLALVFSKTYRFWSKSLHFL